MAESLPAAISLDEIQRNQLLGHVNALVELLGYPTPMPDEALGMLEHIKHACIQNQLKNSSAVLGGDRSRDETTRLISLWNSEVKARIPVIGVGKVISAEDLAASPDDLSEKLPTLSDDCPFS